MKHWLLCASWLATLGLFDAATAAGADDPVWHNDYEAAKTIARRTAKPLFVVFR